MTGEESVLLKHIRDRINSIDIIINNVENELNSFYESRFVEGFSLKNIFARGKSIKEAKIKIFEHIYERKLEILRLHISKSIMKQYESILLKIHNDILQQVEDLDYIGETVESYEQGIIKVNMTTPCKI